MSSPRTDLARRLMVAAWNTASRLEADTDWSEHTPGTIYETMKDNRLMNHDNADGEARFIESEAAARLCDTFASDVDELIEAAKAVVAGRGDIGRLNAAVRRMEEAP